MKYVGKTAQGMKVVLEKPLSVRINQEEDTPADDLTAEFPLTSILPPLAFIYVQAEGGGMVFSGIVDEQIVQYTARGAVCILKARSLAALLLDNEALPQTYYMPSMPVLFKRHIQPYGFTGFTGSKAAFSAKLQITKGMSEWGVLALFCKEFLGTVPRIAAQGVVDVSGQIQPETVLFSNSGGVQYSCMRESRKRYKLLSEVMVRAGKDGSYSTRTADEEAVSQMVLRRRYLNAAEDTRKPAVCGESMLREARRKAYEITLDCPGEDAPGVGARAVLEDKMLGRVQNLTIAASCYILDADGQRWEILLRKTA